MKNNRKINVFRQFFDGKYNDAFALLPTLCFEQRLRTMSVEELCLFSEFDAISFDFEYWCVDDKESEDDFRQFFKDFISSYKGYAYLVKKDWENDANRIRSYKGILSDCEKKVPNAQYEYYVGKTRSVIAAVSLLGNDETIETAFCEMFDPGSSFVLLSENEIKLDETFVKDIMERYSVKNKGRAFNYIDMTEGLCKNYSIFRLGEQDDCLIAVIYCNSAFTSQFVEQGDIVMIKR